MAEYPKMNHHLPGQEGQRNLAIKGVTRQAIPTAAQAADFISAPRRICRAAAVIPFHGCERIAPVTDQEQAVGEAGIACPVFVNATMITVYW